MLKRIAISLCVLAIRARAQTVTISAPAIPNLPQYTVGIGPSWTRGANTPYGIDFTVGVRIAQTQWYSWTTVSTPVNLPPVTNATPAVSTIMTGGAWVPIQNSSGSVSLIFIVQAGFSAANAASSAAPAFTGTGAVAFRLRPNLYLMPYAKAANASTSATSGALATAVFQPGAQIVYSFGK
jgi:hypothetical protein